MVLSGICLHTRIGTGGGQWRHWGRGGQPRVTPPRGWHTQKGHHFKRKNRVIDTISHRNGSHQPFWRHWVTETTAHNFVGSTYTLFPLFIRSNGKVPLIYSILSVWSVQIAQNCKHTLKCNSVKYVGHCRPTAHYSSGVTYWVGVTRGGNWRCHPFFLNKTDDLF